MKKINSKMYYISMFLGIINNNILICMEEKTSQKNNIINVNNQALSLCSTNSNITIEEKKWDQQGLEHNKKYNDTLIKTLRDNLNNIFKEGKYDFKGIRECFQNLGEKIFIPFVKKLLEKGNYDKEAHKDQKGIMIKYIVEKENDRIGFEKKENIFFYGHYKKEFDKVGVEINDKENSVFYGFWFNDKKFLGVEFKENDCFMGVYDEVTGQKLSGLVIKPDQFEIITKEFNPYIVSKKNFNIDRLGEIHAISKEEYGQNTENCIENVKKVSFYLTKLEEGKRENVKSYGMKRIELLNQFELERKENYKKILKYCIDSMNLVGENGKKNVLEISKGNGFFIKNLLKENENINFWEYHSDKAGKMYWRIKYPGTEDPNIITNGKSIVYNNEKIGVTLLVVFDQNGVYNVRLVKDYFNKNKDSKAKRLFFIRDNFFELEQDADLGINLRRDNIFLAPKIKHNTWIDILNKNSQGKKYDLFWENYYVKDFNNVGIEKRQSKNICFYENGTIMYKDPCKALFFRDQFSKGLEEFYYCTLVNVYDKVYENGIMVYKLTKKKENCFFLREYYEREKEGKWWFKTDENGEIIFLSNGKISCNVKKIEDFIVYSCIKNNYEYNIYVQNNKIVKIFIFDEGNVTILYPQDKSFAKINNQNIIKNENKCDIRINYSDEDSDKEFENEFNEKTEEFLYEDLWKKYELQNLGFFLGKIECLQKEIEGNVIKKYLLPENKIIDKKIVNQKNSTQKKININNVDIKENVNYKNENFLKIYALIKEKSESNKKEKSIDSSWKIKNKNKKKNNNNEEKKNKDKINISIENVKKPDDNYLKNNNIFFFRDSDCINFKYNYFLGENSSINYVLHDWNEANCVCFLDNLKKNNIYNQFCDILSTLIYEPSSLSKKKIYNNIYEARLNNRYRFYFQKIDKDLYKIDSEENKKQKVANSFFIVYYNIDHIKYKKNL